jgi:hypothetical protein
MGLPHIPGSPISVHFQPQLSAHRGILLSGKPEMGTAVHAASFIRLRKIVLEDELLARPDALRLILAHELLHFLWPRLSNALRAEYSQMLRHEIECRARGELGESSEVRKNAFLAAGRCWREYICESFCDSGAWIYCNIEAQPEIRLAKRWQKIRLHWFRERFARYWNMRYL